MSDIEAPTFFTYKHIPIEYLNADTCTHWDSREAATNHQCFFLPCCWTIICLSLQLLIELKTRKVSHFCRNWGHLKISLTASHFHLTPSLLVQRVMPDRIPDPRSNKFYNFSIVSFGNKATFFWNFCLSKQILINSVDLCWPIMTLWW